MSTGTPARQPAGAPTGGRFAATARSESDVTVSAGPSGPAPDVQEALERAGAQVQEARQTIANATSHLLAQAVLKYVPEAAYLELEDVDTGDGPRVYVNRVLDSDGGVLVDDLVDFGETDGESFYDEVYDLVTWYDSAEHAAWCDAVDDPARRTGGPLSHIPDYVLDLHAAQALYPEGGTS